MANDRMLQGVDPTVREGHPHVENMHPTPTLQDVIQAIAPTREALGKKIDAMNTDLGLLRDDHRHLAE
ncbi:hypothetical protein NDU88_001635 [Pleurodeles waltl]|uniref:Uncharacterized protein n=1 Tax=Pleurodeles waltl TaxID=8319 RepID=A0AAV7VAJ0_PLEWA|nr:hypothetical protein NDU88_001635 [Pleurodeles waltl]